MRLQFNLNAKWTLLLLAPVAVACADGNAKDGPVTGVGGTSAAGGGPAAGGTNPGAGGMTVDPSAGGAGPGAGGAAPGAGGAAPGAGGGPMGNCMPSSTPLDPTGFPTCPMCMDRPARCIPKSLVESIAPDQVAQLAACDDTTVCVPDVLIQTMGNYDPPVCTSISGAVGRCLSDCIGAVASLGTFLPQDTCPDGEKCAPCADPRTGESTGACTLACDTGPQEPNVTFERCCSDDSGICVPPDIVDETQASALAQGTCGADTLCAPEVFADSSFTPAKCTSVAGAEGRCISTCVDLVAREQELLPQDTCADDELCAPCTDPRTGELTAACTLGGDMPTEEPVIFDSECCAGTGLCVPTEAVPERYSSLLPPETCAQSEGEGWVCAPKVKLEDLDAPLPKCQVLLAGLPVPEGDPNQFGACIPQCIADSQIAGNPLLALGLAQSDCQAGWVCAPCINPLDSTRTGACD